RVVDRLHVLALVVGLDAAGGKAELARPPVDPALQLVERQLAVDRAIALAQHAQVHAVQDRDLHGRKVTGLGPARRAAAVLEVDVASTSRPPSSPPPLATVAPCSRRRSPRSPSPRPPGRPSPRRPTRAARWSPPRWT